MNIEMEKFFKFLFVLFCFSSCINKKETPKSEINPLIIGDWYSLENNSYEEYYFDERKMSTYGLSGNIYSYEYNFMNNEELIFIDSSGVSSSQYIERIIKIDSTEIVLKDKTLYRLNDNNTLGSYFDKRIPYDSLEFYFLQRNASAIPFDSLIKKAGEPLSIEELFK